MELKHVKGNTYYLDGRQLMPVYLVDDKNCIIMDPGRKPERAGIDAMLTREGLHLAGVMVSHAHYDHVENASYLKNKYQCLVAMPRQDAEICRDRVGLRNHLYTFSPGLLRSEQRLRDLICPTDTMILPEESKVSFAGAEFDILHTPGHSPSHICIITPDDVCFAGDCLLSEENLRLTKMPFAFDLEEDMRSKRKLMETSYAVYLFAHQGVHYGSVKDLGEQHLRQIDEVLALFLRHVPVPRTLSEIYATVNQELGLADGHPLYAYYLERNLRPYLDYLMDEGKLVPAYGGGAPALAPAECAT